MSVIDIITMVVRNLFKRITRTILTILGVVIGTLSIVVLVSLGLAMNKTFEDELGKLGDITLITVHNNNYYGRPQGQNKVPSLDNNAISAFRKIPGVQVATPIVEMQITFASGKYLAPYMNVSAMDPEAFEAMGYMPSEGRLLLENDKLNILFGAKAAYNFQEISRSGGGFSWGGMQDESKPPKIKPLESKIKMSYDWRFLDQALGYYIAQEGDKPIKTMSVKGVGVLEEKGSSIDYQIFMSLNQLKALVAEQEKWQQEQQQEWGWNGGSKPKTDRGYVRAYVKCYDLKTVKEVNEKIRAMGFFTEIPSQSLDSMENISNSLQVLLSFIGGVSLVVAVLGIANTMITAIYERTREIGIMKVIGASLRDIQWLFLLEAAMIGFLGGAIGVLCSLGVSYVMNTSGIQLFSSISEFSMQTTVSLITPELCIIAIILATVMGLVSGYLPARRAMKLSSLTAMRAE